MITFYLKQPPSPSPQKKPKLSSIFINDDMITAIHRAASGNQFKDGHIWNVTRIQRLGFNAKEYVHVRCMDDMLPEEDEILLSGIMIKIKRR